MCKIAACKHLKKIEKEGETISFLDYVAVWWHAVKDQEDGKWFQYL